MNLLLSKTRNPFLLLALLFFILFLVVFWIFISPLFSRATAYTQYAQENTVGYIILQPYKVQKYIRKLAPTATRWIKQVPRFTSLQPRPIRLDWFHNLPREFSLLFDYIPGTGFETGLVIKEKRNRTAFMEELNSSRFLNEFCFIEWRSSQTSYIKKDLWLNKGFVYGKKNPSFTNISNLTHPLKLLKNNHLFEFLWINRDQNADIILEHLIRCFQRLKNSYLPLWQNTLQNIDWIYLHLNLIEDNLIEGIGIIHPINPTATMDIKESVVSLKEWIQTQLPSTMQLEVNETTGEEYLSWKIRFYGFEPQLKRALGNFSD